jgi:hypothetical protein
MSWLEKFNYLTQEDPKLVAAVLCTQVSFSFWKPEVTERLILQVFLNYTGENEG